VPHLAVTAGLRCRDFVGALKSITSGCIVILRQKAHKTMEETVVRVPRVWEFQFRDFHNQDFSQLFFHL